VVEYTQLSTALEDALFLLRNDETHHLAPPMDEIPPNLKPRNINRDSSTSEMHMHLEAWAVTDMTDLAVEQRFDNRGYVVRRGKRSRPPDFTKEMQFNDKCSRHVKLQAKDCALNNRYCSTVPPASYEELEELLPSRILKYQESHCQ
jgi:hypothetical protein